MLSSGDFGMSSCKGMKRLTTLFSKSVHASDRSLYASKEAADEFRVLHARKCDFFPH